MVVAASRITEPLAGSANVLDVPRRPMLVAVATAIRKVRISRFLPVLRTSSPADTASNAFSWVQLTGEEDSFSAEIVGACSGDF